MAAALQALVSVAALLFSGPRMLALRAALRGPLGADGTRRWARAAGWGAGTGVVLAVGLVAGVLGWDAAAITAILALLIALAWMDLAWRWLPLEWVGALGLAGLIAVTAGPDPVAGLAGGAAAAGVLLALQLVFRMLRGVEALGTGDILLIGAIGLFSGFPAVFTILAIAAATGLGHGILGRFLATDTTRTRYGVAFGTHLAIVFALWLLI